MVWVVFALMMGIAVFCVLWPLSRARLRRARSETDASFYRLQLAEVDRDTARGMIATSEAQSAKAEVARRFIAASDERDAAMAPPAEPRYTRVAAAVLSLVAIPTVALGVYLTYGRPDLPDAPLEARKAEIDAENDFRTAISKIELHLAAHPEDGEGWKLIAPVYARLGRWPEAARAYRETILIVGSTPERQEAYGEARVQAARGSVDDEAKAAFEAVLKSDPKAPKARFFVALATEQAGDIKGAIDLYGKIVADYPNVPWSQAIQARIDTLRRPDVAAIASAAPKDQGAMIRGMVAGLAAKLAQNGRDPEGWLRLVRSYTVLKEPEKARTALADARKALAGDGASLTRLDDLARELGIGGT